MLLIIMSKCKQLRPLPWVRGQWQWCYGSNMSIIIIIIINNYDYFYPKNDKYIKFKNNLNEVSCEEITFVIS